MSFAIGIADCMREIAHAKLIRTTDRAAVLLPIRQPSCFAQVAYAQQQGAGCWEADTGLNLAPPLRRSGTGEEGVHPHMLWPQARAALLTPVWGTSAPAFSASSRRTS